MTSYEPDPEALREENRRMRYLRLLISLTTAELMQGDNSLEEAEQIIERTRRTVLALFPGKERAFELIYRPRFSRILEERYGPAGHESVH